MALSAIATALFTSSWPVIAIAVVCAAFGATAIGWNGVYLAEVAKEVPQGRAGLATGGALFFTYFGVLTGPALFAFLVEGGISYPAAYLLVAAPALACGRFGRKPTCEAPPRSRNPGRPNERAFLPVRPR